MSHGHKRVECKPCGKAISSCRCMKAAENIEYTICDECEKKDEMPSDDVCCCGDSMASHDSPFNAGHSPLSMRSHYLSSKK